MFAGVIDANAAVAVCLLWLGGCIIWQVRLRLTSASSILLTMPVFLPQPQTGHRTIEPTDDAAGSVSAWIGCSLHEPQQWWHHTGQSRPHTKKKVCMVHEAAQFVGLRMTAWIDMGCQSPIHLGRCPLPNMISLLSVIQSEHTRRV